MASPAPARARAWLLWAAVPVAAALYQVSAKLCADALAGPPGALPDAFAAHWPLLAATVGCDLLCFGAWLRVLERWPLSAAFPLSAASYVLVVAAGALVFGEPVRPAEWAGAALILAGVALLAPPRSS